jgi:hypothetical protein
LIPSFSHQARLSGRVSHLEESNAMTTGRNSRRSEIRTRLKVLVELCSFESAIYEFAYTVDVSSHGARVLTKNPWQSNQRLAIRSVHGNLYSPARVAYCQSVGGRSFAIGLELHQPTGDWTQPQKHSS